MRSISVLEDVFTDLKITLWLTLCLAALYDIVLIYNISLMSFQVWLWACACLRARWRVWMDQVGMGNAERQGALTKGEVLPRPASSQSEVRILTSDPAHSGEQPIRLHCSHCYFFKKILSSFTHVVLKPYEFIYEHKHLCVYLGMTWGQVNNNGTALLLCFCLNNCTVNISMIALLKNADVKTGLGG